MSRADQRKIGAYVREQVDREGVTRLSAGRISRATGVSLEEVTKFFLNRRRYFSATVSISCPKCGKTLANREESRKGTSSLYCAGCAEMVDVDDEHSIVYFDVVEERRDRFLGKSTVVQFGESAPPTVPEMKRCELIRAESVPLGNGTPNDLTLRRFETIRYRSAWKQVAVLAAVLVLFSISVCVLKKYCGMSSWHTFGIINFAVLAVLVFLGRAKIGDLVHWSWGKKE